MKMGRKALERIDSICKADGLYCWEELAQSNEIPLNLLYFRLTVGMTPVNACSLAPCYRKTITVKKSFRKWLVKAGKIKITNVPIEFKWAVVDF